MSSSNSDNHGGLEHSPPKPNQKLITLILRPLIMTLITSLFLLFLGLAAFLLLLLLAAAAASRRPRPRRRSTRAAVRRLPCFRVPTPAPAAANDCAVCLDAVAEGQWCRALPACGHAFHRRCVDAWLVRVPACPVCRASVRLDFDDGVFDPGMGFGDEAKLWLGSRVW